MKILVTGAAGFIGYHVSRILLSQGHEVLGVDVVNDYYDPKLKWARIELLKSHRSFNFDRMDLAQISASATLFKNNKFDRVIHLAAQAGVRYSIENPHAYVSSNLVAFVNILEGCRHSNIEHLIYASSSSVYGANTLQPFSEHQNVDHPVGLYAATKKANELMAHSYSSLYQLPTTGLRFFTVYGPWGRPDMALFKFTKGILEDQPIDIYNHGNMKRDFTYIDDIVDGVIRVMDRIPGADTRWDSDHPDPSLSFCPYNIFNIGNNNPVKLMDFIETLENHLGKKAIKNMMPMQPGDVPSTSANIDLLEEAVGFKPHTSIEEGIKQFVRWYREYYLG